MLPSQIQALVDQEVRKIETTAELQSTPAVITHTNPWYNDFSHTITDSTIFRLILIVIVVEWIIKNFG
ncbi:hypothetical protein KAT92_05980 [Candidatus Babeliales bacterium]|nr:hypothetical protein [Candidatus Babeliales bacterium]